MRKEIAYFVILCGMVSTCKGFFDSEEEKYLANLEAVYIQNVPAETEDVYMSPDLFVKMKSLFILYEDVFITANGLEGVKKILEFKLLDVSLLVENRIVLVTNIPGIIVHCQFSYSSSHNFGSVTAQKLYNSIRATLPVKFLSTHSFGLVKVSKLVDDDDSLVAVSGDKVKMNIHSLKKVNNKIMLRFVIELNGRDEPPFLVFTSTNCGVSRLSDTADEMVLEIWDGMFTRHDVFGYIIKFYGMEAPLFQHMFGRRFDELLSALSRHYFITKMESSSSDDS